MNYLVVGIVALLGGLLMLFLLSRIKKDSKFAKFGVNIKRVHCPNCDEVQPLARKPKNKRQALYGGWTCKNCGTEMDKFGVRVSDSET